MPILGLWLSCSENEEVLPEQQSQIRSYLRSSHTPKLISETEKSVSLDVDPPFYSVAGDSAYRYIRNYYAQGREARPQVEYGDEVQVTFRMYLFENKDIVFEGDKMTMPFYSNDAKLEDAYYAAGLTPGAWTFEPLIVELGRTQILKGFELSLVGCRERDTVETYMTYNLAYGDKTFGIVPKESPVAIYFTVDAVKKK